MEMDLNGVRVWEKVGDHCSKPRKSLGLPYGHLGQLQEDRSGGPRGRLTLNVVLTRARCWP